jgi:hypothetical protein
MAVRIELLLVPGCPNAEAARQVVVESVDALGLPVTVREVAGDFPSPTVLVDGVDVMTDAEGAPAMPACRLDVPTVPRVLAAVRRALATSMSADAS